MSWDGDYPYEPKLRWVPKAEYFDGRPVQSSMTDRNRMQLLEYLEEMRSHSRPVKQVKLTTEELAYLVALCNEDVFGRSPTPGKGGSTGSEQASNSSWPEADGVKRAMAGPPAFPFRWKKIVQQPDMRLTVFVSNAEEPPEDLVDWVIYQEFKP